MCIQAEAAEEKEEMLGHPRNHVGTTVSDRTEAAASLVSNEVGTLIMQCQTQNWLVGAELILNSTQMRVKKSV